MTCRRARGMLRRVWTNRFARWQPPGRGAVRSFALVTLASFAALAGPECVRAETTTLEAVAAPIVRINVPGGDVTIRTWQRNTVAVDGAATLVVQRRLVHVAAEQLPLFIPGAGRTPDGRAQLPAESFVVASIPSGPREQIVIRMPLGSAPGGAAPLTVTVPADAVFVSARTGTGNLEVDDYRGGTFVGVTTRGRLALSNFAGTAFVQTGRGPLHIGDSAFDRLRARTVAGTMVFERCHVREIEATSVSGSLVFDAGAFEPGLARFESARGQIAVGTSNGVIFAGHAGGGKVFTNFERVARTETHDGGTTAFVAGGGPLVTATTQAASVFFYDGSLRARAAGLSSPWQGPLGTLSHPALPPERSIPAKPARRRSPFGRRAEKRAGQSRALAS